MSNANDFIIKNGVLKKYKGSDGDVVIPNDVVTIGKGAFFRCGSVKSISIPSGVTTIEKEAFWGCKNLISVSIPDGVTSIGRSAFSYCESLLSINIPDGIKKIDDTVFACCKSLTDIHIPDGVKNVGTAAFGNCHSLKSIILPESVTSIGDDPFMRCELLRYIVAPKVPVDVLKKQKLMFLAAMGFFAHSEKFKDKGIIKEYEKYAFSQKKKLLFEIFKDDFVAGVAFYANAGKITIKNIEEEFLVPAQKANAMQCVAFLMNWKNENISQEETEKHFEKALEKDPYNVTDMKKLWSYKKLEDGTLSITSYKGEEINVVIPPRIGKNVVTDIGKWAFYPFKRGRTKMQEEALFEKIESVIIPEGIISISDLAFHGCNLAYISIPNSVTIFGELPFRSCDNLTIYAPAGSHAEKYAKENNIPFVAE